MTRIPLAQRLAGEDVVTVMARLCIVRLRDYFRALERQSGDERYSDVYYGLIRETLEDLAPDADVDDSTVMSAVATLVALPQEERVSLIYHIMVEPFR